MKILKIIWKAILVIVVIALILAAIVFLFLNFAPSVGKSPDKKERTEFEGRSKRYYDGQFHNASEVRTMSGVPS